MGILFPIGRKRRNASRQALRGDTSAGAGSFASFLCVEEEMASGGKNMPLTGIEMPTVLASMASTALHGLANSLGLLNGSEHRAENFLLGSLGHITETHGSRGQSCSGGWVRASQGHCRKAGQETGTTMWQVRRRK